MNKLLCEVLNMCYEISTTTVADVFFDYAPHCKSFSVYVYRNGWTYETAGDMEYWACSTRITRGSLLSIMEKLWELKEELEGA